MQWRSVIMNLITRSPYYASRKSGLSSVAFRQYLPKSTGERLFKPWALFKRQDLKIAVIGLTTDDTAKIGNPEYFTDIEFRKPADEAKLVIQELQQTEKPDIIIAATHMGHYDNGEHGSNAPGDVEMARALPAGSLAMIVGGHSQDPVCMAAENKNRSITFWYAMQTGSTKWHLDCTGA